MIIFFKPAVWKYTNSWEMMDPGSQKNSLLPDNFFCEEENEVEITIEIGLDIEVSFAIGIEVVNVEN